METLTSTYTEASADDLVRLDLNDPDFEQFLLNVNQSETEIARLNNTNEDSAINPQAVSKESVNENLQQVFIHSCEEFLREYSPLYDSVRQVEAYAAELSQSLAKIDDLSSALRFQNKSHLFKLEKLQSKEEDLQHKTILLGQLHSQAHIDPDLIQHLLHGETIDEKFFKAFQAVQSLKSLHDQLALVEEGPEQGLRNSLLKNFLDIRSIGVSKMLKALNVSVQKSSAAHLRLFRQSLEDNEEGYAKFLDCLFKQRKQIIKEKLVTLKNKINYSMTSKMNIFLNELFLSFFEIIRTEKLFMKDVFDEGQAQKRALQVADELFAEILQRVERSLVIEKDFFETDNKCFEVFKIRECLERNRDKFMSSMNITEEEIKKTEQKQDSKEDISDEKKMSSIVLVNKLITEANELIQHNLNNEADILLQTKFNIQRIAAYQCIVDLVEKIASSYQTIFEEPERYNDLSILQFLKPLESLLESKLMKKTPATCIFCVNVQTYLLSELSKFQGNSKELALRLKEYETQVEDHLDFLTETNVTELLKFGKADNFEFNVQERQQKKDPEESLRQLTINAKRAFVFLLNLQSTLSKKLMFRDVFLIQDELQRQILKQKIITSIGKKYEIFYNELNEFSARGGEGEGLEKISAKVLGKKFGLDVADYIEASAQIEASRIFTFTEYCESLRSEEQWELS